MTDEDELSIVAKLLAPVDPDADPRRYPRNPDGPEAAAVIRGLIGALTGLVSYAEAVRHTAGMGKHQLARLEAAKTLLASLRS